MIQDNPDKIDDKLLTQCPLCGQHLAANAMRQHLPTECDGV